MRVGLIAPASTYLPKLGASLKRSLEHGLGVDAEVVVEVTKHNEDIAALTAAIQRFGLDPAIEIVVAPLNTGIVHSLLPIAAAQQLCLVGLTLGEDLIFDADPLLFVNSFELWQSAWLAGFVGASDHGPNAATSAALHDSGYGMMFANGLGAEAASGRIVATAQTHVETKDESPQPALDMIVESSPAFVTGLYSGVEAHSFLQHWFDTEELANSPLMWLPSLAVGEPSDLQGGDPIATSVGRWTADAADDQFGEWHHAHVGRAPNAYSVLASEAGSLIAMAAATRAGDSLQELQRALTDARYAGPRGRVSFNDTGTSAFTAYDVVVNSDGRIEHQSPRPIEVPPVMAEQVLLASQRIAKAGWLNPYLVA